MDNPTNVQNEVEEKIQKGKGEKHLLTFHSRTIVIKRFASCCGVRAGAKR
jgi:hypothetical protein